MYWIFGAGEIGKKVFSSLESDKVCGFIDNNVEMQGKKIFDKIVYSAEKVQETILKRASDVVIIATVYVYEIKRQLEQLGINNCICYDDFFAKMNACNLQFNDNETKIVSDTITEKKREEERNELQKKVNSIVLFGYNTDDYNLGCRATSVALENILRSDFDVINCVRRYELIDLFDDACGDIFEYIACMIKTHPMEINCILDKIIPVDGVVINGEGSFIFRQKPRKDLYVFCLVMYLCVLHDKPFFVVNFMISGDSNNTIDKKQFDQAALLLSYARKLCVRDPRSLRIAKERLNNVCFVPDALFSRFLYYQSINQKKALSSGLYNIDNPYIIISGNSEAAYSKLNAITSYRRLIEYVKDNLCEQYEVSLVVMECCKGDNVLKGISEEFGATFIPVETDVDEMAILLQNAKCYISGRYHPSILAIMGGTPCILTGSNSHKTDSLKEVIGETSRTFPPFFDDCDCKELIEDTRNALLVPGREKRIEKAKELSVFSNRLSSILKMGN